MWVPVRSPRIGARKPLQTLRSFQTRQNILVANLGLKRNSISRTTGSSLTGVTTPRSCRIFWTGLYGSSSFVPSATTRRLRSSFQQRREALVRVAKLADITVHWNAIISWIPLSLKIHQVRVDIDRWIVEFVDNYRQFYLIIDYLQT